MPRNNRSSEKSANRRATSYDVAKLAGVSQSAVSRVFKEGASASEEMRQRVLAAASEVGYRPNAIARGLITRQSDLVAVVISRMTNLYYPEVLVELTQAFSTHNVRVLLFTIEREADADEAIEQILQYQVGGVVAAAQLPTEQMMLLESAQIPVVMFNRIAGSTNSAQRACSVRCDQEEGERWLVSKLVESGHSRFALISGPSDSAVSVERTTGALTQLSELGFSDVLVVSGNYSYESGRYGFDDIIARSDRPPDAIIAANDVMAIGCIDQARQTHGMRVPDQLSVVGFDGVGPASFAAYQLTTVRQPIERMTEATVALIRARVNDPSLSAEERVFAGLKIAGGSARLHSTAEPT